MNRLRADFNQQLDVLRDEVLRLGGMVDEAIQQAVHALVHRESDTARQVIRNDQQINQLRYHLEEESYRLLSVQQPVLARDLRRVVATIALASNLERMADHASGIAVLAQRLNKEPELAPLTDIARMSDMVRGMLQKGLQAYLKADADMARQMVEDDRAVNQLNAQILQDLLFLMANDPQTIRRGTFLFWVVHNLERIGDRTKNIGERIVYVTTGELADFDVPHESEAELDEFDPLGKVPL
jgi:phosphate transport system protein